MAGPLRPADDVGPKLRGLRVAVTGASGFVGSHLVPMLLAAGADVVAIDEGLRHRPVVRELADRGRIEFLAAGSWPYIIDDTMRSFVADCDALVHLAFSPVRSRDALVMSKREVDWNLLGTLDLLSALGPTTKQVCLASSAMVYDPGGSGLHNEQDADPASPYGVAKLATEQMVALVGARSGFEVTSLRFGTIYGRWDTAPRAVPNFINSVLRQEPILLKGGADVRDYIHVDDVARAVVACLVRRRTGVFNVATGVATRTDQLAEMIADLGECPVPVHRVEDDRPASRLACDPALARSELGFVSSVPLRIGIRDAFRWRAGYLHESERETPASDQALVEALPDLSRPLTVSHRGWIR